LKISNIKLSKVCLKHTRFVYFIFLLSIFSTSFAQSMQDMQRLKSEYEKYQKDSNAILTPVDNELDLDATAPQRAEIQPYTEFYSDGINEILNKESKHYGYDFFTKRDSVSFWENLPTPSNYLLGPGDNLVVSLWGETQLRKTFIISREGNIYDDKVGLLNITGKDMKQARAYLSTQFGRVYATLNGKSPSTFIDISLGELRSINVNFVGHVKFPGVYPIHPFSSLITGLIQSGGVDTTGSLRNIQIKRNGKIESNIDLYDYFINGDLSSNIQLRDQDIIVIPPRNASIFIDSAVVRPGIYESIKGESVYDLIQYSGGLTYDASKHVGVRTIKDINERTDGIIYEAFYEEFELTKNILVKNGDQISVLYLSNEQNEVEIIGQVKAPGKYHFFGGMTFNDLVLLSGGFSDTTFWKSVYKDEASIIRRRLDSKYAKVISVNLNDIRLGLDDFDLQNLDRVVIHANPNYFEKENVKIFGEVKIPGSYPLLFEKETLQSILNRAGGKTSKAMNNGIAIFRDKKYFKLPNNQIKSVVDSLDAEFNKDKKVRVAWQNENITIMPGDSIIVKESPGTVNISGQIYNPGLIEFQKGKKLRYYLNASGGLTNEANKNGIIVVYANGTVSPGKWYLSPKIEDGSTIIVNKKPPSTPFNITEFASTITSLLTSLVTIIVLSQQLGA
jgi:protein involved in polysaccharide export with SLBB domain